MLILQTLSIFFFFIFSSTKCIIFILSTGTGFSSSLGSGGVASKERMVVIAGSVGGVVLVVLLVAGYCFCFPAGLTRRRGKQRRENDNSVADDQHKNGNGAVPLVNGGSLVVTSASRGSVLLNVDAPNDHNNASPQIVRQRPGSNIAEGEGNGRRFQNNGEYPRALEPNLQNNDPDSSENRQQTLSMSIPDVTRVEPQISSSASSENKGPTPQFFTLGRHATRTNSSSSTNSRHSFHDSAGPSNTSSNPSPHRGNITDLQTQCTAQYVAQGGQNSANSQMSQDQRQLIDRRNGNPFQMYRNHDDGDVSSLYRDGSIGGDSLNEGFLCDDRTASPPPPAPSGPPGQSVTPGHSGGPGTDQSRTSPYTPLTRRSLAML